jgi:hypothetical protein
MDELRLDGMRSAADGVVKSLLAQGDDALAGRGDAASFTKHISVGTPK